MASLGTALTLQAAPQVIYDKPLDGSVDLRIAVSYAQKQPGYCCTTHVQVTLADRSSPRRTWDIATIDDEYEFTYSVQRTAPDSIVLVKVDASYGFERGGVKLFLDLRERRLLKRVDFALDTALAFVSDAEAERVLGVSPADLDLLRAGSVLTGAASVTPAPDVADRLRHRVEQFRLPSSTYREFARARPEMVAPPFGDRTISNIEESIGAVQAEGDRIWFGRTFYDGEGQTGIGDIGYLDGRNRITMLGIRAAANWSIDTMLVEQDTIWAALTSHGEGADGSGGLLEYTRRTKRARVHRIPDPMGRIIRASTGIFVTTSDGVYVLRLGTLTRFRAEPALDGGVMVVVDAPK